MTAGPIIIELAGTPTGKGRPRFVRSTGHAFTPAATRSYESALRLAAQDAMDGRAPLEGALSISIEATFPLLKSMTKKQRADAISGVLRPAKKPDCDNLLKVIDSCNEVVWKDDAQIVDAQIIKVYGERPALRIEVRLA